MNLPLLDEDRTIIERLRSPQGALDAITEDNRGFHLAIVLANVYGSQHAAARIETMILEDEDNAAAQQELCLELAQ